MQKEQEALKQQRRRNDVNVHRHLKERDPESKPVIIVPPLGNVGIVIEHLAATLGILTIPQLKKKINESASPLPAVVTAKTIERGLAPSPEGICIPFKIGVGYMEQEIDEVQEIKNKTGGKLYPLILTHRSSGFCRERQYGDKQLTILEESPNKDFDFYIINESLKGIIQLTSFLSKLSGKSFWESSKAINQTIERFNILTEYEDKVRYTQSLLGHDHVYDAEPFLTRARELTALKELNNKELKRKLDEDEIEIKGKKLNELDRVREKPKGKIIITGEVFQCEEFTNYSSNDVGHLILKSGFYFEKNVGVHEYTSRFNLWKRGFRSIIDIFDTHRIDETREAAKRGGLINDAGGHSVDTVATVQRQKEKSDCDGIIIIEPFNCTPTIVAKNIIQNIKSSIPRMIVTKDEQAATAGMETRIEAFLDLIERKNKRVKSLKVLPKQGEILPN